MTKADQLTSGVCEGCGDRSLLIPLHGPKGGPLRCPLCVGKWNAEHTRRRKWGRIIIKAMKMYKKEGGSWSDFDKLKRAAMLGGLLNAPEITLGYGSADTIGAEVPDVTSELLADTLKLTHPDRQPAERKQLAQRVTQELLALQPFVFPAAKPEPAPAPRDTSFKASPQPLKQPSRTAFPCELCADTVPGHYCDACRAEWGKARERERQSRAREATPLVRRPPAAAEGATAGSVLDVRHQDRGQPHGRQVLFASLPAEASSAATRALRLRQVLRQTLKQP